MTTYITFRHYILKKNFKNILLNLQYIFDCIIAQFQSESRFIGENTGGGERCCLQVKILNSCL